VDEVVTMTLGGGGDGGDALLIGPILDWWERHTAKRDARRAAKAEARNQRRASNDNAAAAATEPTD
jgi:hypothetical protein